MVVAFGCHHGTFDSNNLVWVGVLGRAELPFLLLTTQDYVANFQSRRSNPARPVSILFHPVLCQGICLS